MEFTKLSEVPVVETATDTDKVLIEQNGEIKRVPKTEVGGGGGNVLTIESSDGTTFTASMTLTDALAAFRNHELSGVNLYVVANGISSFLPSCGLSDASTALGSDCIVISILMLELELYWTASGISAEPPA